MIYWDDICGLSWSPVLWDSIPRGGDQGSIMEDGDEGVLQVRQTRSLQVSFFSKSNDVSQAVRSRNLRELLSNFCSGTKVSFEWDPKGFHNVEKVN